VTALSGGVGGARMLRGLSRLDDVEVAAVVNVGDDEQIYGLDVSPDIDTVVYTLAGMEGPQGWGYADEEHVVMGALEHFPIDTWFRIGDRDMATHLFRTARLREGWTLSQVTTAQAAVFGVEATVLPATDVRIRTELHVPGEGWLGFQDYFVDRHHAVEVDDVRFAGVQDARPAPGVVEALQASDVVVIGPSNPPLSIWPTLAVPGVADAIATAPRVVAVSPLFGGRPVKGPTDRVMAGLGLPPGTAGVLAAYDGLLHELIVDASDASDLSLATDRVAIRTADTRIAEPEAAEKLAALVVFG
jgi:LPPG:FO 2-phospho-L-lactate transferase